MDKASLCIALTTHSNTGRTHQMKFYSYWSTIERAYLKILWLLSVTILAKPHHSSIPISPLEVRNRASQAELFPIFSNLTNFLLCLLPLLPPLGIINGGGGGASSQQHNIIKKFSPHPYFDFDVPRNITTRVGQTAFINCRVEQIGDKWVSDGFWRGGTRFSPCQKHGGKAFATVFLFLFSRVRALDLMCILRYPSKHFFHWGRGRSFHWISRDCGRWGMDDCHIS